MKKVIKLTESELIKIIKRTINEDDSEYYEISADEYKKLLIATGYNAVGLARTKKFGGKPIKVIGTLDLSHSPVTDLGKLFVSGSLFLTDSKIKDLKNVTVTNTLRVYGTPYQKTLDRIQRQKELDEAQERREEKEWDLNNPNISSEGKRANAVFKHLVNENIINVLDDDEEERLNQLKIILQNKEEEQENLSTDIDDYSEKFDEIQEEIDEIEEEIEGLESKNNDVYGLIPERYEHYNLRIFKTIYDDYMNKSFAVGDETEADNSIRDYMESMVDETNYDGVNPSLLERHIDGEYLANYFEDMFREDVYDTPENYDIQRELSKSQEEEILVLELEKYAIEHYKIRVPIMYPSFVNKEMTFLNEENDIEFTFKYEGDKWILYKDGVLVTPGNVYDDEDTEEQENEREDRVTEIEYEIIDITDSPDGDLNEYSVEEVVENRKSEVENDPMSWIRDYDMDISNFVNHRDIIADLVDDVSYDVLSPYDGNYYMVEVMGEDYVVILYE
jgi:hypothetical protein